MACRESVRRGCDSTDRNYITGSWRYCLQAGTCSIILLVWAGACAGSSGPGIGIKLGAQTLEDPIDLDETTRARFEVELSSPLLADDHFDFALTFGGSPLGSVTDEFSRTEEGVLIEESYTDHLAVFDLRLAARLYPLGDHSRIRPYVGAGIGYFWLMDYWHDEYAQTFEDPFQPGVFHTIVDEYEGSDRIASGFFPFITAGVAVPVAPHTELMFDFQYDFDKVDDGIDLGGPIYMFGARVRF